MKLLNEKWLLMAFFIFIPALIFCEDLPPNPAVSLNESIAGYGSRSFTDPGLKKFLETNLGQKLAVWPPESWDLKLLTLAAFYYQPELDEARAKWGVKKAGVITAGGRLNPGFGFKPQYDSNSPAGTPPWILEFNLDIPVETAGKRGYRVSLAENISRIARYDIAGTAWKTYYRVETAMINLYKAVKTGEIVREKIKIQENISKSLKNRMTHGEISPIMAADDAGSRVEIRNGITEIVIDHPSLQLTVKLRKDRLLQWGLEPFDVLDVIRTAYSGETVGQVYQGNKVFDLAVILDPKDRDSISLFSRGAFIQIYSVTPAQ